MEEISDIISGHDSLAGALTKAISSIVGAKAASVFLSSVSAKKVLSGRDILANFPKHKGALEKYELHQLSTVNEGIFRCLEVEKVQDKDKALFGKNIDDYFTFLTKHRKEAAAHFATLYVSETYSNAVAFLAKECPYLTMALIQYVKSIR